MVAEKGRRKSRMTFGKSLALSRRSARQTASRINLRCLGLANAHYLTGSALQPRPLLEPFEACHLVGQHPDFAVASVVAKLIDPRNDFLGQLEMIYLKDGRTVAPHSSDRRRHGALEFPNIGRPVITQEGDHATLIQFLTIRKVLRQQQNVTPAITQRRDLDHYQNAVK